MKITAFILLVACLQASAIGYAQKVTLTGKSLPLDKVFVEIRKQTGFNFIYSNELLRDARKVDLNVTNTPLEEVLRICFQDQPLTYSIIEKIIVVKLKPRILITPPIEAPAEKFVDLKGRVINQMGEFLSGASVKVKGMNRGTVTDAKGNFELKHVPAEAVLVVSYAGYEIQEVNMAGRQALAGLETLYIALKLSDNKLDEMQVIAYGKVSKRLNVSNVVTIKGDDIMKNPVPNVLEALQGRVPGMFIQQNTGMPGGSFTVEIRGQSSFNANQPLYVIDGVAYPAGASLPLINPALRQNTLNVGNALNYFDPALIESVEILKDGAATAIYGSRGAYGVILITTRKAKAGKPRLNANIASGFNTHGRAPQLLNTQQYLMLRREGLKNDGDTPGQSDLDLNGTWDTTAYTNWQKYFTGKPVFKTRGNVTYSGGSGTTSYLIGASYNREGNVQVGKGNLSGGGMNFNLNSATNDQKFSISLTGSFNSSTNTMVPIDFAGSGGPQAAPNAPSLYLPNGQFDWSRGDNPAASLNLIYNGLTNNIVSGAILKYNPIAGLTISATMGYNLLTGKELYGQPTTFFNPTDGSNVPAKTNSQLATYTNRTWNIDPYVDYVMQLGSRGRLDALVGFSVQNGFNYNTSISGTGFIADAQLASPSNGTTVTSNYSESRTRYIGYFARFNYVWDNKYILEFSGRRDGSTRFGPSHQFGEFGSVAAGWIFSEEKWIKNNLRWLSYARIKGSLGTTGGDGIGDYKWLDRFSTTSTSYQGGVMLTPSLLANPLLHWEHNKQSELQLSLAFLKNRISVDASYYKKTSSDQLVSQPLSSVTGYSSFIVNSPASIQNTGIEAILNTKNIQTKNFSWTTSINVTIPRNKLVAFPGGDPAVLNPNYVIGKSLRNLKLYQFAGVNPQTGHYNFTNAKGVTGEFLPYFDPVQLSQDDKTAEIDLNPKYYGGIQNQFTYKGFLLDFLVVITSRKGNNFLGQQDYTPGIFNVNTSTASLRRWQKQGDVTDVPQATASAFNSYLPQFNFKTSSGAYSNATYARLQNVYLSYTFPAPRLQKAHITALSFFLQGQNILTISKYKDLDPENLSAGQMPPLRIFTGGINITL